MQDPAVLAVVVITMKNCLRVFAESMRVIPAMIGNLPKTKKPYEPRESPKTSLVN